MDLEGLEYVFATVLEHAKLCHRSAYDASYPDLGSDRSLPLATKDARCHLPKAERNGKQLILRNSWASTSVDCLEPFGSLKGSCSLQSNVIEGQQLADRTEPVWR
jgi:hypothetical protein